MRRLRSQPRTNLQTRRSKKSICIGVDAQLKSTRMNIMHQADDVFPVSLNIVRKTPDPERFSHAASWPTGRRQSC
eukprot:7741081-Pyramimonas_sp.AAC.1